MATPVVGAVSTAMTIPTPGGSPRPLTIAIGEATPSKHRALVVWTNAGHSANAVSGITAGGAAMTALGMGGAGSTPQLAPYVITDPGTDGSGNCALSISLTGNGEYNVYVWWAVVDDIAASSPYTDLTAGGALGGSSNAPSTVAQTVPAGSLLLAGMIHNFSSSYSLAGTGSTEHMHGLFTSKPISIASRTTTGAVSWSTSSSNIWLVSAILFAGDSGDTTAPTLSSPSGTGGVGVCSGGVSTNEGNGTLYAVVTSSATAPTAAQVKAGQDNAGAAALRVISQAVSATGTQSIASGAVSAGTRYMYFMHEDAATNQSTVVGSASFTVTSGGDTTAPVLSSPTGVQTGSTTATVGATTDEGNGTMYAVVTTSATQPSVAQIKSGQNNAGTAAAWSGSVSVSSTGAKTLAATGLTASTAYYAHLVHTDAAGNDSNRVSSSSFTTAAPTRTITLSLTAADGTTPRANLTGLKWAVWDVATPDLIAAAPAAKGAAETTDASGVLVITYTSSLSVGGTAYLVVTDSNGDPAQSPAPKAFAGPVVVS